MKTTVYLPEELLREWKKRAAEQGTTLKEMWTLLLVPPEEKDPLGDG